MEIGIRMKIIETKGIQRDPPQMPQVHSLKDKGSYNVSNVRDGVT